MNDQSTVYADIVKVEKKADEPDFRYVHARISDETKDLDGQTADYDWLKRALPDWFKWGNVRDMHKDNVVGKAKELTDVPAERGFDGVLKIVDPTAVIKLDEGLFTGVSVGIKGPRVVNNKGAAVHPTQPGRIVDGKIVEISLVDHPCNENCKLTVAKGSNLEMITKGAVLETIARVDILKDGALYWYKRAKWNAAARQEAESNGHAMAGGRFPIDDASDVSDAVHLYNTGHGQTPDVKAHIKSRAQALGVKNPFKREKAGKLAVAISPADLETYKSRFHPAFANAGVALADGSYVIMDEGDLLLAKALKATGFGNVIAADLLIQRRAAELAKTVQQPEHPMAPGARDNRDNPEKNAPPPAKPKASKNPDKESPAHQSPDASGSQGAEDDQEHPHPNRIKPRNRGRGNTDGDVQEEATMTHGDTTGSMGTQTNTAKYATGDPAEWSDKKLAKAVTFFKETSPDLYKQATNSYQGDGRALLEQIARDMQGRIYSAVEIAQGGRTEDDRVDKPEEAPGSGLLNDGALMRDGDPRVSHNTPAQALAQGGPKTEGGTAAVSSTTTALPLDSAPQPGGSNTRISPAQLPGSPATDNPTISSGGPAGNGGLTGGAGRTSSPALPGQAGPQTEGGRSSGGAPNTAYANPSNQPGAPGGGGAGSALARLNRSAKPDKKKKAKKYAKVLNKLAKAAVADHIEAALPDSTKAAVTGLLKKFAQDLEKSFAAKYVTVEAAEELRADIEKLGKAAQPGGPFVGPTSVVEKVIVANNFSQPETILLSDEVLEKMDRLDKMSQSSNRSLATSAAAELKKMLSTYFPEQDPEQILQKRKRSK